MAEKRRCENCGKVMKQQFIGLKHCKCGTSWQKGVGYFQRTNDMVFALERKVVKKSKNSIKTKQVPVVRYKPESNADKIEYDDLMCELPATHCRGCKGDKGKVDGCQSFLYSAGGKKHPRVKVGDAGDMYENGDADSRCTDCGAKHGHSHHVGCDCETCPICGGQLLICRCGLFDTPM